MPRSKAQSIRVRLESRGQIISTARRLFSEKGYDSCQVSDIAREAGMSHGNIYWYFPSKEEILRAILTEGFEALVDMFAEVSVQPGAVLDKLNLLIDRYSAFARDQDGEDFLTLLLSLTAKGGNERLLGLGFDMRHLGTMWHQSVNTIFAQAQAEGQVMPEVAPELLTTFFFSFFTGLIRSYPREWREIPSEVLRATVYRLVGVKTT
jgi:AcrR family transcriptional regulator